MVGAFLRLVGVAEYQLVGLGLVVCTGSWDILVLGLLHEFVSDKGAISWPKDALLGVTLLVRVAHIVAPFSVRRIHLWAKASSAFLLF